MSWRNRTRYRHRARRSYYLALRARMRELTMYTGVEMFYVSLTPNSHKTWIGLRARSDP